MPLALLTVMLVDPLVAPAVMSTAFDVGLDVPIVTTPFFDPFAVKIV